MERCERERVHDALEIDEFFKLMCDRSGDNISTDVSRSRRTKV